MQNTTNPTPIFIIERNELRVGTPMVGTTFRTNGAYNFDFMASLGGNRPARLFV